MDFPAPSPPSNVMNSEASGPRDVTGHDRRRTARQPKPRHVGAGQQRHVHRRHALARHRELAQHVAAADRRRDGVAVLDLDFGVAAPLPGHGQHQVLPAYQRHGRPRAQPDLRLLNRVARGEQRHVLELPKAPLQQPFAFLCPLVHRGKAVHHDDHPPAAPRAAGGQAIAALFGVARLQAVRDAFLHEGVAVLLLDIVVLEHFFIVVFVILWEIGDQAPRQRRDVAA